MLFSREPFTIDFNDTEGGGLFKISPPNLRNMAELVLVRQGIGGEFGFVNEEVGNKFKRIFERD